ncbi:hypothetical protein WAJ30_23045, partial [Acinetobacter baumannii]
SANGFIFPLASVVVIPSLSNSFAASAGGFTKRNIDALNAVPADSPVLPASTIIPIDAANSSIEIPNALAGPAAYLN